MGKIPVVAPGNTIVSRETPMRQAPVSGVGNSFNAGDAISTIGKSIEESGAMLEKALLVGEQTKAQNILSQKIADIRSRAEVDTDLSPEKQKKYHAEIDKAVNDTSSFINIPYAKGLFQSEATKDAEVAKIQVNNSFTRRIIDNNKAEFVVAMDNTKNEYISSVNPQAKRNALLKRDQLLKDMVAGGYLSREDAAKQKIESDGEWPLAQVESDITREMATTLDDSYIYNQLKAGSKGVYSELPAEERTKALEKIQQKIRSNKIRFEFELNQYQDTNEVQMLVDKIDGKLTEENIKDTLLNQGVRRAFGERMLKDFYKDHPVKTDIKTYNSIRELQNSNASPSEINQKIIERTDKLSAEDQKALINKTFTEQDKKRKMQLAYNSSALKIWAGKNIGFDIQKDSLTANDVVYDFFQRVDKENAQGKRIDEIATEVVKDAIKQHNPSTALLEDTPHFIADRNQIRKVFEKESKLKGKKVQVVPLGTIAKDKILVGYDQNKNPIYDEIGNADTND
jgi:hypothetical protein